MKFYCELAISALDLLFGRITTDSENFVVIAFLSCHLEKVTSDR